MHDRVRYYRIRNWEQFQHYKDRRPPWIKLHQSLADDFEFHNLPDYSKVQLVSLWILASKHDNMIPDHGPGLERHNLSERAFDLPLLVNHGFLELAEEKVGVSPANMNASSVLSLARSRESETEAEAEEPYVGEVLDRGKPSKRRLPRWRSA